ncbi:Hydroxyethylthiazole kinase family-domain-containing protein [Apiosordaria backusii]|uniref:Hydroxyethylthiazole kinase family-domain-containing protein n=1 Tax=Apiosordaria backusii TaxID=314023 RepID=A0AA40EEL6_9PEZI|nr:Hydroxyethylthiazole kinase family-domain-containing protein [Apiosordaria backusii]
MPKPKVNYSLYLVTDSTPAVLKDPSQFFDIVEKALRGGVTLVQLREKTADTGEIIGIAKKLHKLTKKYEVPLLINDRVDVALAVGCEGVHIGQDDMDLETARELLGDDKIIGVTVSNVEEAIKACEGGADYLGIGTVYATPTKTNTKSIIGAAGVREILAVMDSAGYYEKVNTVCIGGLNKTNIPRILYQSQHFGDKPRVLVLNGVAVVSAIMSADDPEEASKELMTLVNSSQKFRGSSLISLRGDRGVLEVVGDIIKKVHEEKPLTHNITNLVVQNFAANVALAVGGSPIMANYGEEAADLAKLGGSLVVNMGTVTPEGLLNYYKALQAYNVAVQPVVFDPVGAGATSVRREAVKSILANGYLDVIKGNEGEIKTVWGSVEQQKGVDSRDSLTPEDKLDLVVKLARREQNVVVMTGKTDYVSDGYWTVTISNGHEYLGLVTGTGCTLGTAISVALAAYHKEDKLWAVVTAMLHFEIAAEIAAEREDVKGPGTFISAFLDELYNIRIATVNGDMKWLERAKVTATKL